MRLARAVTVTLLGLGACVLAVRFGRAFLDAYAEEAVRAIKPESSSADWSWDDPRARNL
jgi:hypothetical protein